MAKKTRVTIDLFSVESIDKAIDEINSYAKSFDSKMDLFIKRLAERGVEIAKDKIKTFNAVFTTELLNNVHLENRDGCYFVVSDSEHTAFVEFGTGSFGERNPYPYPLPKGVKWKYNVGETIQYADEPLQWGEWTIPQGVYYWFYFRDGRWFVSCGMRSRPFMYETAMEMGKRKTISEVAKEVFGNA